MGEDSREAAVPQALVTMQLRLRTLRGISFTVPSSWTEREGCFRLSLHEKVDEAPLWAGASVNWEGEDYVSWDDVEVGRSSGLKGVVVRLSFSSSGSANAADRTSLHALHFSGLSCLGSRLPHFETLPKGHFVFHMAGGYYLSVTTTSKPCYLSLEPSQAIMSYDTALLSRLVRLHRAMKLQHASNVQLKELLVRKGVDPSNERCDAGQKAPPSLRQQVFSRHKDARTRLEEMRLRAQVETLRSRIDLLRSECSGLEATATTARRRRQHTRIAIDEHSTTMTSCLHALSKDKAALAEWSGTFKENRAYYKVLRDAVQTSQLRALANFRMFFPVQGTTAKSSATIRWTYLPTVEEARSSSHHEIGLAVCLGWVAQLLAIFSSVLDLPLRFPVKPNGCTSTIFDKLQKDQSEFPLYTKGVDSTRTDYGIFLLNRNLAQIRTYCGLFTSDPRPTLHNLSEVMSLATGTTVDPEATEDSKSRAKTLSAPPAGASPRGLIVKSSPALIPGPVKQAEDPVKTKVKPASSAAVANGSSTSDLSSVSHTGEDTKGVSHFFGDVSVRTEALSIPTSQYMRIKHL